MLRLIALLTAGVLLLGLPSAGSAQVSNLVLGQAKSRLACGAGVVVSAVLLPNGSLQVTCARNPVESSTTSTTASTVAQTTGLVTPAGFAAVISVTIVVGLTGGDNNGTTTTTTSPFIGLGR